MQTQYPKYPNVEINLTKIKENASKVMSICKKHSINLMAVTKGFCADLTILEALVEVGIESFGDSRLENIARMQNLPVQKSLLRLPMISEADLIVSLCDISLNSEIETIKALNESAARQNKIHSVVLMIEIGDLREGILPVDVLKFIEQMKPFTNIALKGIGTNLTCYGGILPDEKNMEQLASIAIQIEQHLNCKLEIISGGNTATFDFIKLGNKINSKINHFRIGEGILTGRNTALNKNIDDLNIDSFTLTAELIEIKEKASIPTGTIGLDAFGNMPTYKDYGIRKRAILAIGRQDIEIDALVFTDPNIRLIGGSGDHTIIDITDCKSKYSIGDTITAYLQYPAMLRSMTSEYIYKKYIK